VDSAEDYYLVCEAVDEGFNRGASDKVPFSIDILVESTDRGLKIRVSNVQFAFNTAELRGDKTFRILDKIVAILQKYDKYSIVVEGHTDSTGDETYNVELSKNRAEAVGTYLVDNGIDPDRLEYVGYGPKFPIDTNATVEGRRRNRRVEFLLKRK
jgi:outer membrane protein OmpA-like peptidoglycan-associated protein